MEINYRGMEATLIKHDDYYEVVLSNNAELITFKDYEELKQEGLITEKEETMVANNGRSLYKEYRDIIRPILRKYGVKISDFKNYGYINPQGFIAFGKLRGVYWYALDDDPNDRLPVDALANISQFFDWESL